MLSHTPAVPWPFPCLGVEMSLSERHGTCDLAFSMSVVLTGSKGTHRLALCTHNKCIEALNRRLDISGTGGSAVPAFGNA